MSAAGCDELPSVGAGILKRKPSGFFRISWIFHINDNSKKSKKNEKKHKNHARALDEKFIKIYIHFHRRNTELRLSKRKKKFFDRSGKEITD